MTHRVKNSESPPQELASASADLANLVWSDSSDATRMAAVENSIAEARRAVEAHLAGETTPVRPAATTVAATGETPPAAPAELPHAEAGPSDARPAPVPTEAGGGASSPPSEAVIPASGEAGPRPPASDAPAEVISAHADAG